jgi:hypothetical protein
MMAMGDSVSFNLQTFLSEMRQEWREGQGVLVTRMEDGFSELTHTAHAVRDELVHHTAQDVRDFEDIHARLAPLERLTSGWESSIRWTIRIVIGSCLTGLIALGFSIITYLWKTRP